MQLHIWQQLLFFFSSCTPPQSKLCSNSRSTEQGSLEGHQQALPAAALTGCGAKAAETERKRASEQPAAAA
jgi:hypothetical protein